jgi:hypothetical protein
MKRTTVLLAACLLAACSESDTKDVESVGERTEDLNGSLSPKGFLIKKSFAQTDETLRRANTDSDITDSYYSRATIGANGSGIGIRNAWHNLSDFKNSFQQFGTTADITSRYYNRGDLGLGREMHCVDRIRIDGQIACYVTNYAAGDAGSEFTFGMSSAVAFANMNSVPPKPVATVAMVFRQNAPEENRVIFVVFDENGVRTNTAPLDRHGLNFAKAYKNNGNVTPDASVAGTPGVEFNNHIPSNCLTCHGGSYNAAPASLKVSGRPVFLPFDLDLFEYDAASGHSRANEAVPMRKLNEMVRKVSALSNSLPVARQLDVWYNNTQFSTFIEDEVFEKQFDGSRVPSGWTANADDTTAYRSVVRGKCRGCHMASETLPFDDAQTFRQVAALAANDICRNATSSAIMPHALQTTREFWQSTAPRDLETYFRVFNSGAADTLHNCTAGNLVTLDPHLIMGATVQ